MAHNTHNVPPLFQTTDEANSSCHSQRSFATLPGGGGGGGGAIGQPSFSNQFNNNNNNPPPPSDTTSKRPRGRPSGSKNKPKAPIFIKQQSENALKSVVIEIPIGKDIIESLINFARQNRVDISVLNASGSVTDIALRDHNASSASIFPIHGTFPILSLTGSCIGVHFPSLVTHNNPSFPHSSSSSSSSFAISVAGPQGQVFGGVIGGRVMAASVVIVMAIVFKKTEFHRLSLINENLIHEGDQEVEKESNDNNNNNINNLYGGGVNNIVPNSNINNNNNGIPMIPNMSSAFGVSNSVGQLNRQMHVAANMNNMLQWNHLNHL